MSTIEAAIRAVMDSLEAAGLPNIVMTTHTEFTEIAELPAFVLYYPTISDYTPNEVNERHIEFNPDGKTTTIAPMGVFKNLDFEFDILTDSILGSRGLANLHSNYARWARNIGFIVVEGVVCEVHDQTPQSPQFTSNDSNLKKTSGQFTIEGVEIVFKDATFETGYVVQERIINLEKGGE